MSQIIVTIAPDGATRVEAAGVSGPGCQDLTRAIEEALGRTTADQKKPEFVQDAGQGQHQQLGSGL